jgi:hypothetical protein
MRDETRNIKGRRKLKRGNVSPIFIFSNAVSGSLRLGRQPLCNLASQIDSSPSTSPSCNAFARFFDVRAEINAILTTHGSTRSPNW